MSGASLKDRGAAAREAIARGTHDPGALAVLCEERRRAADSPVPLDIDLGAHVPDRDVIPHDLESYDAHGGYRRHAPRCLVSNGLSRQRARPVTSQGR